MLTVRCMAETGPAVESYPVTRAKEGSYESTSCNKSHHGGDAR